MRYIESAVFTVKSLREKLNDPLFADDMLVWMEHGFGEFMKPIRDVSVTMTQIDDHGTNENVLCLSAYKSKEKPKDDQ